MKIIKLIIVYVFILSFAIQSVYSKGLNYEQLIISEDVEYVFRLINGDLLTGSIIERSEDEKGYYVRMKTIIGNPIIYEDEVIEIRLFERQYRHSHRVFLLPTAMPISDNHYIGNFELGMFMAGVGITDYVSIIAGRSILPFALPHQQISLANAKISLYNFSLENIDADIFFAAGGNLAYVNDNNRMIHYYGNATYLGEKTSVTAAIFYKAGSQDYAMIRFRNEFLDLVYPDGSFGVGFGLDTKFSHRHDLRFIAEIWNNNINLPSSTLINLGFRLAGTMFSADFGLAFFTEPLAVPFVSFVWTPR